MRLARKRVDISEPHCESCEEECAHIRSTRECLFEEIHVGLIHSGIHVFELAEFDFTNSLVQVFNRTHSLSS